MELINVLEVFIIFKTNPSILKLLIIVNEFNYYGT